MTEETIRRPKWVMSAQDRHAAIVESLPKSLIREEIEAAASEMLSHFYAMDGDPPGSWERLPEEEKNDMRALASIGLHAAMAVRSREGKRDGSQS